MSPVEAEMARLRKKRGFESSFGGATKNCLHSSTPHLVSSGEQFPELSKSA